MTAAQPSGANPLDIACSLCGAAPHDPCMSSTGRPIRTHRNGRHVGPHHVERLIASGINPPTELDFTSNSDPIEHGTVAIGHKPVRSGRSGHPSQLRTLRLAWCRCGWRGPVRAQLHSAWEDAAWHVHYEHGGSRPSWSRPR